MTVTIRSERYRRHKAINRSIEAADSLVSSGQFASLVGDELALEFRKLLDSLFVPNEKNGVVEIGGHVNDEGIPIFARSIDEHIAVADDIHIPTPTQLANTASSLLDIFPGADPADVAMDLRDYIAENSREYLRPFPDNARAVTSTAPSHIEMVNMSDPSKTGRRIIFGRPFVAIRWYDWMKRLSPDVMVHELTHVKQNIDNPVSDMQYYGEFYDFSLRSELEAYHIQALGQAAMAKNRYDFVSGEFATYTVGKDNLVMSDAVKIDNARLACKKSGDDEFAPTDLMKQGLGRAGIRIGASYSVGESPDTLLFGDDEPRLSP